MRASSALVLSLFLLCSQRHLASAILPPFAIAAVEAMWAKRTANSATSTTKATTSEEITTHPSTKTPPRQAETKLPEMMLHQVLPKDENGNKKMVETFLEGKMMLTDPMNGAVRTEHVAKETTKPLQVHQGVLGIGGLGGLYPAVRHYASCHHNGSKYDHGEALVTDHPCDHCQCRNGKISCYWQVCDGSPDFNCVPLFVPGTCCPVYSCGGVGGSKIVSHEENNQKQKNIKH